MSDSNRNNSARKVAYSAVGTALSLVMIFLTAFVPVLTVAPLIIVALAWNVVIDKCGLMYGLASMAATVGLGFLTALGAGFGVMIIVGIVFVPYALLACFLKKITYVSLQNTIIRLVILAAFASLAFMGLFFAANAIFDYVDIIKLIDNISGGNFGLGYAALNLIALAAIICIDYVYTAARRYILKRLK